MDISDAVAILNYLFNGDPVLFTSACDANDSADVNITDAVYLLRFLFQGGTAPPAPFPTQGSDPPPDELPCGI